MSLYLPLALAPVLCLTMSCRDESARSAAPGEAGAATVVHALQPEPSIAEQVASFTDASTAGGDAPVTADALPLEEFLARLDACDVESCRRQLLVARVEGLPLPPKPVWQDFASRLASCKTSECVIELFPVDRPPPIDVEGCKPLDQQISSETFSEHLGLVCRVRVARAKAARRQHFPCKDLGGGNPDFTINEQGLRMLVFNELVRQKHLDGLGLSSDGGVRGSHTLHASYALDQSVSDRAGTAQGHARVYFCMSGDPGRYHPYFFALLRRGEQRADVPSQLPADVPVLTEYIEMPPARRHVVYQLGEWKLEDAVGYEMSDLDNDGVQDVVIIDRHRDGQTASYMLRACLYKPKADHCRVLETSVRFGIDPEALANLRWSTPVLSVDGRVVTVSLKDNPGELKASARFRVHKRELQRID